MEDFLFPFGDSADRDATSPKPPSAFQPHPRTLSSPMGNRSIMKQQTAFVSTASNPLISALRFALGAKREETQSPPSSHRPFADAICEMHFRTRRGGARLGRTLISPSLAKGPSVAMILGTAAASVSCTASSGRLLMRVRQGSRFTRYGLGGGGGGVTATPGS